MSRLMDLMDIQLGIKSRTEDDTISHNENKIAEFKEKYNKMKGYRGPGMCHRCSAMANGDGYQFCVDKMKSCQDANLRCTGTK